MRRLLQHVQLGSQHLAGLLLQHGFLQRHPPLPSIASAGVHAEVSPAERGERLMSALIAIGEVSCVAALTAELFASSVALYLHMSDCGPHRPHQPSLERLPLCPRPRNVTATEVIDMPGIPKDENG